LLGHLGGEFRRRLAANDLRQFVLLAVEGGKVADGATAPFLGAVVPDEVAGLAGREEDQQRPQVVAVGQAGKRPSAAPRQKLSKALRATSSSSAAARGRPASFCRAKATSFWK
jgi:hypothetical protein